MNITGHVHGNTITIDSVDARLEEGALVEIIPIVKKSERKNKISGSWQDSRSAEEIIADIRSSRVSRSKEVSL